MAGALGTQKQIEHFLENQGPQLSTSLINFLVSNYSIPEDTARKRLSRLKFPITKIKGLFPKIKHSIISNTNIKNEDFTMH